MRRIALILSSMLVAGASASAQTTTPAPSKDTTLKAQTIEVIQSYKPQVKKIPRPEFVPAVPPTDTSHPVFSYDVPKQLLYYTYNSLPLRPLALGKDSAQLPFPNYVKLGGGNLSTLYLDLGIGGLVGKNYETAFHLHHISQQGDISDQKTALSGLEADGTFHSNGNAWHVMANAERSQYGYYGYDHIAHEYSDDSTKQTFTTIRVGADLQNETNTSFGYHPSVTASLYTDNFNASETTFGFNAPFSFKIDTAVKLHISVSGMFTQLSAHDVSNSNNIIQATPGISFRGKAFSGFAYLSGAIGKDQSYMLPSLQLCYTIPRSQFSISAGWNASLRQNTYEQLSSENPYMYNVYPMLQTRTDEVYGSLQGNVGAHLSFSVKASWLAYDYLPLFLNDSGDHKQFYVVYDKDLNAIALQADIKYQVANTFAVGLHGNFTSFSNGDQLHPWHVPGTVVKADVLFRPIKNMVVTFYISELGDMWAVDANHTPIQLDGILDIGGNIEYSFIPRLSVFLQANNIINNKYERWQGYDSYGFNIYGGIKFKF